MPGTGRTHIGTYAYRDRPQPHASAHQGDSPYAQQGPSPRIRKIGIANVVSRTLSTWSPPALNAVNTIHWHAKATNSHELAFCTASTHAMAKRLLRTARCRALQMRMPCDFRDSSTRCRHMAAASRPALRLPLHRQAARAGGHSHRSAEHIRAERVPGAGNPPGSWESVHRANLTEPMNAPRNTCSVTWIACEARTRGGSHAPPRTSPPISSPLSALASPRHVLLALLRILSGGVALAYVV